MRDAQTLVIRLALRPPGADGEAAREHAVRLEGDARMPLDRITAWVEENQCRHLCKECGKVIRVERRHYWRGIPRYHHGCCLRDVLKARMAPAEGYYTGEQAARRLGIGRTTLNRWLKKGKAPRPAKVLRNMLLFERKAIDHLARQLGA
jgi:excisionase family DNA binding protein